MDKPTVLSRDRLASKKIRACFTILPHDISELQSELNDLCQSGMITCFAKYSKELESSIRDLLKVKHVLAISNGSAALQILLSTVRPKSEVLVPSYTFPSTVHAIALAGLKPRFVDVDETTYNICLQNAESQITPNTSAILAVNVFGNPCRIGELETLAKRYNLKLFFDSAAAFGSKYYGHYLGSFGDAEVFSLSGTKVVNGGEGGVITTNDDELAEKLDCLRNYGYSKREEDCLYVGINGKMSELNAIFALWSLRNMQNEIAARREIAEVYYDGLKDLPGISFQKILDDSETNFCTFAIAIDPKVFGLTAPAVLECLKKEGIETLRYFCPPMHKTRAYRQFNHIRLTHSEILSQQNLCLPMHSKLTIEQAYQVCSALMRLHNHAGKITETRAKTHKRQVRHSKNGQLNIGAARREVFV
jgi:dTDP-4-amino-4,6-dideoxygalactose transaminase